MIMTTYTIHKSNQYGSSIVFTGSKKQALKYLRDLAHEKRMNSRKMRGLDTSISALPKDQSYGNELVDMASFSISKAGFDRLLSLLNNFGVEKFSVETKVDEQVTKKYLFSINNKSYSIELEDGETKRLEYMDGCFANVTASVVTVEPTKEHTGSGFLRVEFDNGNVWDSVNATIARLITKQERERLRIGCRIQELRFEAGMTQKDLADATGLLQPNIARIETGRYGITIDLLSRIAQALGKRIDLV